MQTITKPLQNLRQKFQRGYKPYLQIPIKCVENSTSLVSLVYKTMHHKPIVIEHKEPKSPFVELQEIAFGKSYKMLWRFMYHEK